MSKRTIPVRVAERGCPFRLSLIVLASLACVASALYPYPTAHGQSALATSICEKPGRPKNDWRRTPSRRFRKRTGALWLVTTGSEN